MWFLSMLLYVSFESAELSCLTMYFFPPEQRQLLKIQEKNSLFQGSATPITYARAWHPKAFYLACVPWGRWQGIHEGPDP